MVKKVKELLREAYKSIPSDFRYNELRLHINTAIHQAEHMEKKDFRKEEAKKEETRKQESKIAINLPLSYKEKLDIIDEMIKTEKEVINNLKGNKKDDQTFYD